MQVITHTQGFESLGGKISERGDAFLKEFIKPFRHKMFYKFFRRLNEDRRRDGYGMLTMKRVAMKLSIYSDDELDFLYKQCCEKTNFSAWFWWATNPKNAKPKIVHTKETADLG